MPTERANKPKRKRTAKRVASQLAIEKRRESVTQLKLAAWTVRDIAGHLKCSVGTVQSDIDAVFARTQESADDNIRRERALSLARLEVATKGIWPAVVNGNLDAVDRIVRIEKRRGETIGFDAPVRSELSGPDGNPIEVSTHSSLERKLNELGIRLAAGATQPGGTPGAKSS